MGSAARSSIMYALYSKGFGKKAQDLNKREFNGGKCDYQLITKATTADKTAFESNVDNGGADKFVKFTVPVDSSFKVGVKAFGDKKTEVDADFKFDDNLTLRSTVTNLDPSLNDKSMKVTAGADYVTEAFSVEAALTLMNKGAYLHNGTTKGDTGASVAVAANCPGLDWLRVGFQGGVAMRADAGVGINTNVAFAHVTKEYELAAQLSAADLTSGGPNFAGASIRGWFNASDKLKIAAEIDAVGTTCTLGRDMFATPSDEATVRAATPGEAKAKDDAVKKLGLGSQKIQIGSEYGLNGSTTLKGKVTTTSALDKVGVDVAVITKLDGKSSATFTLQNKGGDQTKFGFAYTLEA